MALEVVMMGERNLSGNLEYSVQVGDTPPLEFGDDLVGMGIAMQFANLFSDLTSGRPPEGCPIHAPSK